MHYRRHWYQQSLHYPYQQHRQSCGSLLAGINDTCTACIASDALSEPLRVCQYSKEQPAIKQAKPNRTYLIQKIVDTKLIWYGIDMIRNFYHIKLIWYHNFFYTELIWYRTYQILNLTDSELIRYRTFQILTPVM
jgi:hypothetical protein